MTTEHHRRPRWHRLINGDFRIHERNGKEYRIALRDDPLCTHAVWYGLHDGIRFIAWIPAASVDAAKRMHRTIHG